MGRWNDLNKLQELDNQTLKILGGTRISYSSGSSILPITSKEQLDNATIYSENKSKNYKDSLKWNNEEVTSKHQEFIYKESEKLRDLLLSFGGNEVLIPEPEEDIVNILKYGQFWFGKSSKLMKGKPSQCHKNSCDLWESGDNKKHCRICTGYALSEDGLWRQHSWVLNFKSNSNQIIETTMKRIAYFGFIMNEEQSQEFCYNNY